MISSTLVIIIYSCFANSSDTIANTYMKENTSSLFVKLSRTIESITDMDHDLFVEKILGADYSVFYMTKNDLLTVRHSYGMKGVNVDYVRSPSGKLKLSRIVTAHR
jgi:hypothetical protein